jgi:hypothetical protein
MARRWPRSGCPSLPGERFAGLATAVGRDKIFINLAELSGPAAALSQTQCERSDQRDG